MNNVLALIPARGGSKGIPGKNVMQIGGKPLIAYSILQARQSKRINRASVSTDDAQIAYVAQGSGRGSAVYPPTGIRAGSLTGYRCIPARAELAARYGKLCAGSGGASAPHRTCAP